MGSRCGGRGNVSEIFAVVLIAESFLFFAIDFLCHTFEESFFKATALLRYRAGSACACQQE